MRLVEWTVSLPADMFTIAGIFFDDQMKSYAIQHVKEDVATDYCMPAAWDAWPVGDLSGDEITWSVSRLSNGDSFPQMKPGYCWEASGVEDLDSDDADMPIYKPSGLEGYAGRVSICQYDHNVWLCQDGKYRAQLTTLTGC